MEKKDIEIPFGAFDSELGGFEYTIPEGYKAEIKDGKVIVKKAESEDERIRKELIEYLKERKSCESYGQYVVRYDRWIAWLEKQCSQILANSAKTCKDEQNPTDKVEPKFKVGDEIKTKNEESLIITRIDRWGYWSEDLFICDFDDADKWELVEQKPAWNEEQLLKGLNEAANEWDSKASFSPFYMVMDGDRPTDVKQHITSHADSFKAGVDWIIKKLKE